MMMMITTHLALFASTIFLLPLLLSFTLLPLLLPMASAELLGGQQIKYNGYKLYRLDLPAVNNSAGRERIGQVLELIGQLSEGSRFNSNGDRMPLLDIWSDRPTEVLVAPEFCASFLELMAKRGVRPLKLISEDIQLDINREKKQIVQRKRIHQRQQRRNRRSTVGATGEIPPMTASDNKWGLDLNTYNPYRKIGPWLQRLAKERPEFVELLSFNKTFEGRDLLGIKIGKRDDGNNDQQNKPLIFVDAGVHAREWIAPAAALYVIAKMVSALADPSSSADASLATLLQHVHFVVVPVANPDGYEYSMLKDRLWRKTRSRNESQHRGCMGADANRNWGYRWAEIGASRSPCSNIFPGWAPFSEPEVRAIRDYLVLEQPRLGAYISLHSYGQMILSPWGYTREKPTNFEEQQKLAQIAVEAIRQTTGSEYTFGSIADLLYPASGTSIDYWQHRGVPFIYGVELRPEDMGAETAAWTELHGFSLSPDQIEPTGKEVLVLLQKVGEFLLKRKERTEEEEKKASDNEEENIND